MLILRDKVMCRASRNILIREYSYDTLRAKTVLTLNQIKIYEREILKIWRMVSLKNDPGEDDGCRLNP